MRRLREIKQVRQFLSRLRRQLLLHKGAFWGSANSRRSTIQVVLMDNPTGTTTPQSHRRQPPLHRAAMRIVRIRIDSFLSSLEIRRTPWLPCKGSWHGAAVTEGLRGSAGFTGSDGQEHDAYNHASFEAFS